MMPRVPLRHLLLGIVIVFGVLVAAGQFAFILRSYADDILAHSEAIARHSGGTLSANLEAALRERDQRYADQLVAQKITLPHLVYAAFVDADDNIVAATAPGLRARPLAGSGLTPPPPELVAAARSSLAGQVAEFGAEQRLWGVFPVRLPAVDGRRPGQTGYAVLSFDTAPARSAALRQALGLSLAVLLPILLLSLGIGLLIKYMLTDRIEQLLAYTRSQARGGSLPPSVAGRDELGLLGVELASLMREVLEARDAHARLLDRLPNPIWRSGPDGRLDYINPAWLAWTGEAQDRVLAHGRIDSIHPDDQHATRAAWAHALVRREAFSIEFRVRFADGAWHWVSDHGEPLLDKDGKLQGFVGSCFDLQKDKTAAAEIAASEARFRGLVEQSQVGVYLVRDGRIRYANPCLESWLGYGSGELVDAQVTAVIHPDDRALVAERLRQRESGEVEFMQYQCRGLRRDGHAFPAEVYGTRIEHEGRPAIIGTVLNLTERERDQAALKAAAEVVEASPTVLFRWLAEPGWPVVYVSENVDRWGYRAADMLAPDFRFIDLVHPGDLERIAAEVEAHLEAGRNEYAQEYRLRSADGSYLWIEDLTSVHRDDDGQVTCIEGLVTDIGQRRKLERRDHLRADALTRLTRGEPFTTVLEAIVLAVEAASPGWRCSILLADDDGRHLRTGAAPSLPEFYNRAVDGVAIGEGAGSCGTAAYRSARVVVEDVMCDPLWADYRELCARAAFRACWSEPVVAADGRVLGTFGVYHAEPAAPTADDIETITHAAQLASLALERERRDRALRESEARFREVADNVRDVFWVFDWRSRRLLFVSSAYERIWRRPCAAAQADHGEWINSLHPDDVAAASRPLLELDEEALRLRQYRIINGDGDIRWISDKAVVIRNDAGEVVRVVGIAEDITARRLAEEEIRALNAELEARVEQRTAQLAAANKELETFAYSVSHDLKAPLRGIDGYSHLLVEDYAAQLDDEGKLFVGNIRAGVKQMGRLIDDLLAYSRIERRALQQVDVNIADILRGILRERMQELESGPARIEVDVPDIVVKADPDGLAQALRNLVDNALKYSRASSPPEIRIAARDDGDRCHITVQDNGIGFEMKFHDRIFEIFQRLQRAEDYAGTGVGLAIVRKAMQRMGGRVWAESAPGEGATFHLELKKHD